MAQQRSQRQAPARGLRWGPHLFLRMGVRRGSSSLIGGVILVMPMTLTILFSAPRIEPSTSGYSSPKYSYSTTPAAYKARAHKCRMGGALGEALYALLRWYTCCLVLHDAAHSTQVLRHAAQKGALAPGVCYWGGAAAVHD